MHTQHFPWGSIFLSRLSTEVHLSTPTIASTLSLLSAMPQRTTSSQGQAMSLEDPKPLEPASADLGEGIPPTLQLMRYAEENTVTCQDIVAQ